MKYVYSLEHAPFEEPVYISRWLANHQIPLEHIRLYKGEALPDRAQVRFLIIMGGPMNIYDEEEFPWLIEEKSFIKSVIELEIPVLGICLGGQLVSDVLGGTISKSERPEYGWHTIRRIRDLPRTLLPLGKSDMIDLFPDSLEVFQWHQDTFSIPPDAIHLYSSKGCQNQAFLYTDRVIGLQFHPEMDQSSIRQFLNLSGDQSEEEGIIELQKQILTHIDHCTGGHEFIAGVLNYLTGFSAR